MNDDLVRRSLHREAAEEAAELSVGNKSPKERYDNLFDDIASALEQISSLCGKGGMPD